MNKATLKKNEQLGMSFGKASHKLVKDILFNFIVSTNNHFCYRCKKELTRENYSIEHKQDWLDSADPVGLFFGLDNISFSHKSCNSSYARKTLKKYESVEERIKINGKKQLLKRLGSDSPYNVRRRQQRSSSLS